MVPRKDCPTARGEQQRQSDRQRNILVRNRRKRYLDVHASEYFSASLELADPLMYDRYIRRYQTAQEREAEGRAKGYTGILEADIARSEAKMDALREPDHSSQFAYRRGPHGEILAEDKNDVPGDKDEARARWLDAMTQRFLQGQDSDFDYATVDGNEDYDDLAEENRAAEERYFGAQEAEFILENGAKPRGETGVQDF